jgi:hypothetical protein
MPDNTVRLPKLLPIKWKRSKSKMQKQIYLDWSNKVVQDAYKSKDEDFNISLFYLQLRPELLDNFKKEMKDLEDKYSKLTIKEIKLHAGDVVGYRYLSSLAHGSFFD